MSDEQRAASEAYFSNNDFNAILMRTVDIMREFVKEHAGIPGMPPLACLFLAKADTDGATVDDLDQLFLPIPDMDTEKRHQFMEQAGMYFGWEQYRVVTIFFTSEAWLVKRSKDDPPMQGGPSDQPDREERIMVAGTVLDGRSCAATIPFGRNAQGTFSSETGEPSYYLYDSSAKGTAVGALGGTFFTGFMLAHGVRHLEPDDSPVHEVVRDLPPETHAYLVNLRAHVEAVVKQFAAHMRPMERWT